MENLLIAYSNQLVRAEVNGSVKASSVAEGSAPFQQFAVDPNDASRIYVATLGDGVHRSNDGGKSFSKAPASGLARDLCWTVAVSASDVTNGIGALYVGTQQSALYKSVDGGESFAEIESVQQLDQSDWAFPPAPSTHHVHQITLDIKDPAVVVFGVELGGVYHSADGGDTWSATTADPDPHTLRTHPTAPHRIYEGGGAGPALSKDGGKTWDRPFEGIPDDVRYFFSLAVDSGDPDNVIISGARDPFSGHGVFPDRMPIYSTLLRRKDDDDWETLSDGLPPDDGTAMGTLAAGAPGVFYYMTDDADLYRSHDGGDSFTKVEYDSPNTRSGARALAVLPA